MNQLETARKTIDEIDAEIARLYEKRMAAVEDVVAYKIENSLPVFDGARETAVIEKNTGRIQQERFKNGYEELLRFILQQSKQYQKALIAKDKVAYAGVEGAFAHMVSEKMFGPNPKLSCSSFDEVIRAVMDHKAEFGILPLENNNSGLVGEVMDALLQYPVYITGVQDQKIDQCLLGVEGATLKDIETVYSKDQALWQAKEFLDSLNVETVPYPNTARAAQMVAAQNDIHKAAIGARENASLYGLKVLASNIEANASNTTRFLVIANEPAKKPWDHFSLIVTISNEVGALLKVIETIAAHKLNMDCIQSRPIKGRPFEYFFYIQCFGSIDPDTVQACLQDLKPYCASIKWMGNYELKQEEKQ